MTNTEKLRLDFLSSPPANVENEVSILEAYAAQIDSYASGYLKTVVTTITADNHVISCSLYVLAPQIGYDYRAVTVERAITRGSILFYTLLTEQNERFSIDFSAGYQPYKEKLSELLSSELFNASLKFLVDRVELSRELRAEA